MELFNKRYFIWICFAFLSVSAITLLWGILFAVAAIILLALLLISVCIILKKDRRRLILISALVLAASLLGVGNSFAHTARNDHIRNALFGEGHVCGYVSEVSYSAPYLSEYVVRIERANGKDISFSAILIAEFNAGLSCGDFFEADVQSVDFEEYNKENFLSNSYSSDYPIVMIAEGDSDLILREPDFRADLILKDLKGELSDVLENGIGGISGSMSSALLLGNRNLLPDETLRDFRRAGCYHMLALSGMHVSIIVAIFEFMLKKLFVPKSIRIAVLSLLLIFYVALTGFLPSACRAMLMLWIYYLATALGKSSDSLVSLFAAVSVIVLISPASVLDLGLLLSFLSTFGIIVASVIKNKIKFFTDILTGTKIKKLLVSFFRNVLFMLMATLCVSIASMPVLQFFFGELSLATFFTNLFIGFFAEVLLGLSLVIVLLSCVGVEAKLLCGAAEAVGEFISNTVFAISDIPGVVLSLRYPAASVIVWILFLSALILLAIRLKKKRILAIPPIFFVLAMSVSICWVSISGANSASVEFLSSERGDSLLLSSTGKICICDMSDGSYSSLRLASEVAKEGLFSEIEHIVITHYHKDHERSLPKICARQKVRSVYIPFPESEDEYYVFLSIFSDLEKSGVEVILYERDGMLSVIGGELFVSSSVYADGRAHPSYALSYVFGDHRLTVLENPYFSTYLEEDRRLNRFISESEVLIVGGDGNPPKESFSLSEKCQNTSEICFADRSTLLLSDLDLSRGNVYVDTKYRKYVLKGK